MDLDFTILTFPVPDHLKDTHYSDAKARYGYGKEYKYPHDYPNGEVVQDYLPDALWVNLRYSSF